MTRSGNGGAVTAGLGLPNNFLVPCCKCLLTESGVSLDVLRILLAMTVSSCEPEEISSFFDKARSSGTAGRGGAVTAGRGGAVTAGRGINF